MIDPAPLLAALDQDDKPDVVTEKYRMRELLMELTRGNAARRTLTNIGTIAMLQGASA